jgi:hypothetical protein
MSASPHPLKIFLSYASPDRAQAQKIYELLRNHGADPWLDTENLLPGQDWKLEIQKALDDADVIVLCLSKDSVSREGYVQKEMRLALDRGLEMPEGEIFLVPARLEECDLPHRLRDYQWVDLFTESGMNKLALSLNLRAERVGASPLSVDGTARVGRPAVPKKEAEKPPSGNVINIYGNVTDSNIVLGDDNNVENKKDL